MRTAERGLTAVVLAISIGFALLWLWAGAALLLANVSR